MIHDCCRRRRRARRRRGASPGVPQSQTRPGRAPSLERTNSPLHADCPQKCNRRLARVEQEQAIDMMGHERRIQMRRGFGKIANAEGTKWLPGICGRPLIPLLRVDFGLRYHDQAALRSPGGGGVRVQILTSPAALRTLTIDKPPNSGIDVRGKRLPGLPAWQINASDRAIDLVFWREIKRWFVFRCLEPRGLQSTLHRTKSTFRG
jgi:hypothetical protein